MRINYLHLFFLAAIFLSENHLAQAQNVVGVAAKVYLQGALIGTPDGAGLMRDDLRTTSLLPTTEPYSQLPRYGHVGLGGGEMTTSDVLATSGPNAIVDWLYLELRSATDPKEVLATHSALLQRDGDVVGMDGGSAVLFEMVAEGVYFVALRHRNHLGVMTANAVELGILPTSIDFTDPATLTYGEHAQVEVGDHMAMWAGDMNYDGKSIFQGPGNDNFFLFSQVLSDTGNTDFNANFITSGYLPTDLDLDGQAIYAGPGSDRDKFFSHVIGSAYSLSSGGAWLNMVIRENLP